MNPYGAYGLLSALHSMSHQCVRQETEKIIKEQQKPVKRVSDIHQTAKVQKSETPSGNKLADLLENISQVLKTVQNPDGQSPVEEPPVVTPEGPAEEAEASAESSVEQAPAPKPAPRHTTSAYRALLAEHERLKRDLAKK